MISNISNSLKKNPFPRTWTSRDADEAATLAIARALAARGRREVDTQDFDLAYDLLKSLRAAELVIYPRSELKKLKAAAKVALRELREKQARNFD